MQAIRNDYTAPVVDIPGDCHLHTPPEDYDLNYCFEVKTLRSDRVELRPYVPSLHARLHYDGLKAYPEMLRWLSSPVVNEFNDILVWAEKVCRRPTEHLFYAIYTDTPGSDTPKTDPAEYVFAGVIGFIMSSPIHLMAEPGFIQILPPFQRTHVQTHAAGLSMHRILDAPEEGGLGMRRTQWTTTTLNTPSQNAALRLGFTPEGVSRTYWICPPGKEGARPGRPGVAFADGAERDNWYASVTWREWEGGVREHVDKLMARR